MSHIDKHVRHRPYGIGSLMAMVTSIDVSYGIQKLLCLAIDQLQEAIWINKT